jgi:very-short-patch-repair endonuclease
MNLCKVCGGNFESLGIHNRYCIFKKEDIDNVRRLYNDDNLSTRDIIKLGLNKQLVYFALRGRKRSISKSIKLAHKNHPESFVQTELTKRKRSEAQKNYLKKHPELNAWRRPESYCEKIFQQLIEKNELAKKYDIVREYSFFPYFIDFAFVNIKLAVEVDGSQHWKEQKYIENDLRKDKLLISKEWKVYRIPSFLIKNEFDKVEKDFLQYLSTINQQPKIFIYEQNIIEYKKIKQLQQDQQQQQKIKNLEQRQLLKQQLLEKRFEDIRRQLEQRQQLLYKRFEDIKNVNNKRGCINRLSKLWNVSHTQVRRFIDKNFKGKLPYSKIIDEIFQ